MVPLTGTRMHNIMNTLVAVPSMALLAVGLMDPDVNFYTLVPWPFRFLTSRNCHVELCDVRHALPRLPASVFTLAVAL